MKDYFTSLLPVSNPKGKIVQRRLQSLTIAIILGLGSTLVFLWFLGSDLTPVVYAATPPFDITIVNGSALTNITPGPNFVATDANAVLGVDEIVAALATSDVTVDTGLGAGVAQSGTITLTLGAVLDYNGIAAFRNLTLSATHDIIVQGSITDTVCCDENLSVILNSDQEANSEGTIEVTGEIGTNGGEIVMSGGGGDLTALKTTGFAVGTLRINSATVDAAGGDITIRGRNGIGTNRRQGVNVYNSGLINTTGTGTITIVGRSNNPLNLSDGMILFGGSIIRAVDGDITIDGMATGSAGNSDGIELNFTGASLVETTGTGNINLIGSGVSRYGVEFGSAVKTVSGNIVISGIGPIGVHGLTNSAESTGGGNITITGSSNSTSPDKYGVYLRSGVDVLVTGAGTIAITGTGGAGTGNNYGIYISDAGSTIQAVNGGITLNGTGGGTGNNNYGVYVANGAAIDVTTNGSIDVTGTGANGADGIRLEASNINPSTSPSPITLTADLMSFPSGVQITGASTLRLQPLTPTAPFSLNDIDLGALGSGFSQITIGRDDSSGLISLTGGSIWTTDAGLLLQSPAGGGTIDITAMDLDGTDNDPIILNASDNIAAANIFNYGGAIAVTSSQGQVTTVDVSSGSDSNGGPITINASTLISAGIILADGGGGTGGDVSLQANGDIQVESIATNNTSTGGDVTITGNFVRITGSSGCFIGNCSINTRSSLAPAQGGVITINHQGNGVTPFIVGDASTNGTADNLYTGVATIAPLQSFPLTYIEPGPPDIFIITSGAPLTTLTDDNIPNGNCTLREAIIAANTNAPVDLCGAGSPGLDVITLITGTYSLTITGNGEDAAATGDLDITEDLMIVGAGSANTIIEGAGAFDDRVFDVVNGAVDISGTVIRNGNVPAEIGGGILNRDDLALTDAIITNNTTGLNGGGLANNGGTVTINNSTIGFNSADFAGGGIWNDNILSLNSTTVVSNVVNNLITSAGGGIYNVGGSAVATLTNSIVITNRAGLIGTGRGGGIFNSGAVIVDNTVINDNMTACSTTPSGDDGSGIFNSGTATVVNNSDISSNRCVEGIYNSGVLNIDTSRIADNGFAGLDGGGIHNDIGGVASVTGSFIGNNGHFDGRGAGILNDGVFTLNNTTLTGNGGNGPGGGIFNSGTGTFTANGSNIVSNNATGIFFPSGGGISNAGIFMVNTSTISGNVANLNGGGIDNTGSLIVTNSSIENNSASIGGGINNDDGSVTLSGSTLSANVAGSAAGGIQNISGIVNIVNNSFIGNNTSTEGAGGIFNDGGTLTVDRSTLDNNAVSGGDGGGIYNVNAGVVTLTNSTVSNNSAGIDGGGILVISPGSTATVNNSTFSGNSANNGGAIFIAGSTSVTMTHTTISSNTAASAGGGISNAGTALIGASIIANSVSGGDCSNFGSLISSGYNLVGDNTCNTNFVAPGDITNTDPLLGPLALNAPGNTETHAITNSSSPAIDAAGPTCPPPATDQRGVARPVGPGCDIGAYESPFISPLEAELDVVKTASPDPALLGGKITYVITVTNNGPWPATNLTIVDDLPNPLTGLSTEEQVVTIDSLTIQYDPPLLEGQISADAVSCNQVGEVLTCIEDSRPPNTSVILTLQMTPQTTGNFVNTVQVSADEPDFAPSNNTDAITTTVNQAFADLTISKSVTPGSVLVGEPMTYTITVNNTGPDTAFGVTMVDNLPVGLLIGPVSTNLGVCNTSGGAVSCGLGTMNNGGSAQITILVTPTNFYTVPTTITNTASVAAAIATDPITTNNTTNKPVNITPVTADLRLGKQVSTGATLLGETLVYTLVVTNTGPDQATSVVLTDPLPPGLQFVSATPDQGSCTGTTTVTCNLGTVNVGTVQVVLQVIPISLGTVQNTAQVTTFAIDNNIADNSATSPPTVVSEPHPALTLSKTASSGTVSVGNLLSYTLNVTNAAVADPANNTILTDQLPNDVVFVSASAGCSKLGGTVTCNLGKIAPGASAGPVTISIRPSKIGDITNTASVTSLGTDSNPADNTDSATTSVVALSEVIDGTGGTLTYTDPQGNTTEIEVPPGSLSSSIKLVFTPITPSASSPAGFTLAGEHSFTIEAFTYPGGEPVPDLEFDPPFVVTINYSDSDVANIDDENNLILYYLNGSTWEDVATTCSPPSTYQRNPGINQIAAGICHLTEFGLFGPATTSPVYLPLILKN